MSNQAPPAEKLTAWQRWELAALAEPQGRPRRAVVLPTAAEIERMHQRAHAEGHAEGLAAGLAEGRAHAAQRATELAAVITSINRECRERETQIAEDLLSLALEFARRMVRETLNVRRELIVPLVREAMQQMPSFNAAARLVLHPADAELVRATLGETLGQLGCRVVEDASVERGGCRVESATTQVDATLATRWERMVSALGREYSWIEGAPSDRLAPAQEAGT